MEYFCYLSRSKIDQLYKSSQKGADEWSEKETVGRNMGAKVDAGLGIASILNLFKGGVAYGRKDIIQRERNVKVQYTEKLYKVLLDLAKLKPIPRVPNTMQIPSGDSLCFWFGGMFSIVHPLPAGSKSDIVIAIKSEHDGRQIILDCSLRFFSDGSEPDGEYLIHSGNSRFFAGEISLYLETVFFLLDRQEDCLFGTPLFLKLGLKPGPLDKTDWM